MAYRRKSTRRTTRKAPSRSARARGGAKRSYNASAKRRSTARVRRSSGGNRPQTIRLVIENTTASEVARPDVHTKVATKRRAAF